MAPNPSKDDGSLGFIMRHVDGGPNIGGSRFLTEVLEMVSDTAMGLALIGEIAGATELLGLLHDRGIDPFYIDNNAYVFSKPCMYFAWNATSSWPDWIPEEERAESKLCELQESGRKPWLGRIADEWEVSESMAENGLGLAYPGMILHLPPGTPGQRFVLAQKKWDEGKMPHAPPMDAPVDIRYSILDHWWKLGIYPYPWVQLHRTVGLTIALDIYCRLGNLEKAHNVLRDICGRFDAQEQLRMMVCSRDAWDHIYSGPHNPLPGLLGIHAAKIRSAAKRATKMLQERLDKGPARPFRGKSMEELVYIISANTYRNTPYERLAVFGPERERLQDEHGLLRPPATVTQILEAEERLGVSLPLDYKEFLSITNGLGAIWTGHHVQPLIAGTDSIRWEDINYLGQAPLNLTRESDPPRHRDNKLEWPKDQIKRAISLCADDQEGYLWLFPPKVAQNQKEYFLRAFSERSDAQRAELRRVVAETYGDMEAFERIEWALVGWAAWEPELVPYAGVRDALERLAERSSHRARDWDCVFEPKYWTLEDATASDEEFMHGEDGTEDRFKDTQVVFWADGVEIARV